MTGLELLGGVAAGAALGWAFGALPRKLLISKDPHRPPKLYEYFVDAIWFEHCKLYDEKINAPLKGKQKADMAIVGGGFAGLAAALELKERFPNRRIIILEGACCGYGASGRNAGHALTGMHGLLDMCKKHGPEVARRHWDATLVGFNRIKELVEKEGIDCDLEETGKMGLAVLPRHVPVLENYKKFFDMIGLPSEFMDKQETQSYVRSERYLAAWKDPHGGHLNPAKLARGMKKVAEKKGVEVFERSKVLRITPGKTVHLDTEFGEVEAPMVVVATNAYTPQLGIFKNQIAAINAFGIATEPLSDKQVESLGWAGRENMWDMRAITASYFKLTVDNRIAYIGNFIPYYYDNDFYVGVSKPGIEIMKEDLFRHMFPQLEGVEITHIWGGPAGVTMDWEPHVGVMGEHKNIFYTCAYNGEGVVLTQTAGKIIADLVAGEETELTRLHFVNRKPPYMLHEPIRYPVIKANFRYLDMFGSNMLM